MYTIWLFQFTIWAFIIWAFRDAGRMVANRNIIAQTRPYLAQWKFYASCSSSPLCRVLPYCGISHANSIGNSFAGCSRISVLVGYAIRCSQKRYGIFSHTILPLTLTPLHSSLLPPFHPHKSEWLLRVTLPHRLLSVCLARNMMYVSCFNLYLAVQRLIDAPRLFLMYVLSSHSFHILAYYLTMMDKCWFYSIVFLIDFR